MNLELATCEQNLELANLEPGTFLPTFDFRPSDLGRPLIFRPSTVLCLKVTAERSEINVWIPSEFGTEDNRIQNIPYVRLPAYTHECARTQVHV